MEGISAIEIDRLIPFHKRFSPKSFINVGLKAKLERWAIKNPRKATITAKKYKTIGKRSLSLSFDAVKEFYIYYEILKVPFLNWADYGENNTYSEKEKKQKQDFVNEFIEETRPLLFLDLGCNAGDYVSALGKVPKFVLEYIMTTSLLSRLPSI